MFLLVDKTEEMIGSYGPSTNSYEKKFQLEEAPSGLLARGHYEAKVTPPFFVFFFEKLITSLIEQIHR